MNKVQNYMIVNNRTVKTLADKMKQDRVLNKKIINLSEKYNCSLSTIKRAFKIDNKTTVSQLNTKILNFEKNVGKFMQNIIKGLEEKNIKIGKINITITENKQNK